MKFILLYLVTIFFILVGCKKTKPELVNVCDMVEPVKASFQMGYKIEIDSCDHSSHNDYFVLEDSDTSFGGLITFKSTVSCYDSVRWIIGTDPTIYTDTEFSLFFNNTWIGSTIPVTLIAKLKPSPLCFPDDDGIDTLTRNLYIAQYDDSAGNAGDFIGYNINEDPNDLFVVSIFGSDAGNGNNGTPTVRNLPRGANAPVGLGFMSVRGYYRVVYFCREFSTGAYGMNNVMGVARFSADYMQVTIDYSYSNNPLMPNRGSNSVIKRFVGVRV